MRIARKHLEALYHARQTFAHEAMVVALKFPQQPHQQLHARLWFACFLAQGSSDVREFTREFLLIHVQADSHHDKPYLFRVCVHFGQDAACFFSMNR